jgi:hypothetical protein
VSTRAGEYSSRVIGHVGPAADNGAKWSCCAGRATGPGPVSGPLDWPRVRFQETLRDPIETHHRLNTRLTTPNLKSAPSSKHCPKWAGIVMPQAENAAKTPLSGTGSRSPRWPGHFVGAGHSGPPLFAQPPGQETRGLSFLGGARVSLAARLRGRRQPEHRRCAGFEERALRELRSEAELERQMLTRASNNTVPGSCRTLA